MLLKIKVYSQCISFTHALDDMNKVDDVLLHTTKFKIKTFKSYHFNRDRQMPLKQLPSSLPQSVNILLNYFHCVKI